MAILYEKLFKILDSKNIKKIDLQKNIGLSSRTIAKLSKNENLSLDVLEKICSYLNCKIGDIVDFKNDIENKLLKELLEEKEMKLKGGIYHLIQVKFAYNSNHIEGSTLSEEQTRYIYETHSFISDKDEVVSLNDVNETLNHFRCFDYILDNVNILNEELIKELHKILKTNTSDSLKEWFKVGDYKLKANIVGDKKTTPPKKVKIEMQNLLESYNKKENITFEDILDFHHKFENIHPFQDGNGRVGRLIMFKECLRHNIIPFIIDEKHKLFYYRGLREYENEKGYLRDTCLSAQDDFQKMLKIFDEE
ncbi:helix-turn-helix domain-containing protein [Fusobacterium sp. FSA-380-WT-3A]|nr:helix-turn-helix domain-containing protein [Fusobacterium sp. FSA-380-WT-3A]